MKKSMFIKLSLAALLGGGSLAQAQTTDTWTGGGGDANWSTAGNWSPGAPNAGDSLVFDGSTQTSPNNDLTAGTLFGGVLFAPTAGQFVLSGNQITLSGLVENDATNLLQTINLPLILSGAVTFNTSSNDLNGGASNDIEIGGNVSGSGSIVKIGAGMLKMTTGANTYTGGTIISNGLVDINTGGTFTMSGGSLLLDYGSYWTAPVINCTTDAAVGCPIPDTQEPPGPIIVSPIGTVGYKFTKIGVGTILMASPNGNINASSIDVAAGTLANQGGGTGGGVGVESLTHWGTCPITVEEGAMLRADGGGVCPNPITLMGGDGTSVGNYQHLGALASIGRGAPNGSTTNYNIFTNTITLAADSTIGSMFNTMYLLGNITGPGGLTKIGGSPLFLGGSNDFLGSITVGKSGVLNQGGILQLGSSKALPVGGSLTLNENSTLDFNGNSASLTSFYDDGTGLAILDNTSAGAANFIVTGSANFTGKLQDSGGGSFTIINSGSTSFHGTVKDGGSGGVSVINVSGNMVLDGVNAYTGATIVEGGSLDMNLPSGVNTGGQFITTNNASVTLHLITPSSSLHASSATIGYASTDTSSLTLDLNNYGTVANPLITVTNGIGVLAVNGTINVTIQNPANLTVGSLHLIKYNTITGVGASFVLNPIPGVGAQIVTNAANHSIDLLISQAAITTWTAKVNTNWDLTTTNWIYAGIRTNYQDNEAIFFNDTASNFLVNLAITPNPASVLVNATNNYLFTGTNPLAGGSLTKNGSGTLILDVSGNTFSSTMISAGTLQVGNNDGMGDLPSSISDQGTLAFARTNAYVVANAIFGVGSVVNNSPATISLNSANSYSGGTVVNQGSIKLGNASALGTPATGTLVASVASGASLDLNNNNVSATNGITISGSGFNGQGALLDSTGGINQGWNAHGFNNVQLAGDAVIGKNWMVGGNGIGFSGNGHNLTLNGGGNFYLRSSTLTGFNQFIINGGTVGIESANPFGTGTTVILSNNAILNSWNNGGSPSYNITYTINNSIIVTNGGAQIHNDLGTYYANGDNDIYAGPVSLGGPLTLYNGLNTSPKLTISGSISGTNALINNGPGSVTLSGANTYSGPTTVAASTLFLSLISQGGGTYTVMDGATLDVPNQTGYSTVPMAALTLGSTNGGGLSLARISSLSTTVAPITATNLVLNGTNLVTIPNSVFLNPGGGQYPLVKYGSLSGSIANLTLPSVRGLPASFSNNVANSSIDLVLSGSPVTWVGNVNNTWNINTTANWLYQGASTTYLQPTAPGDAVTFDDSSSVPGVNIAAPVSPAYVFVKNNTNAYSFSGSIITGTGVLIKSGTNTLTMSGNNTYSGGTYVNGGTVALNTGGSAGTIIGSLTINSNATVKLNNTDALGWANGTCVTTVNINQGTLFNATGNNQGYITAFNLTGGTMSSAGGSYNMSSETITTLACAVPSVISSRMTIRTSPLTLNTASGSTISGFDLVVSGAIDGGNTLAKTGAGTVLLSGNNSYSGSTTVSAGSLLVSGTLAGGAVNVTGAMLGGNGIIGGAVTINSGSSLMPGTNNSVISTLTISNSLTLAAGSQTVIKVNAGGTGTNDSVAGLTSITYGGTLAVTNIGATPFAAGQSFQLFSVGSTTSNFAATNLPALASGLGWVWNRTNATLSVMATVNLTPTNLTSSYSNGQLTLSWPMDHTGWTLQSNSVSLLNTGAWYAVPNSTTTNRVIITPDSTKTDVFYRMYHN